LAIFANSLMPGTDEFYMRRCLALARLGAGQVAPNPMVGSVLVHDGRIIGEGYHRQYGQAHAEVNCLASVAAADLELVRAATYMYRWSLVRILAKRRPAATSSSIIKYQKWS
jgi:pyrimidine deaminase RibD-like protein